VGTQALDIVILGLSITSSWGNGHATTYRGLVRALTARGHRVLFLERDVPWYAGNRDLPVPPYGQTALYESIQELRDRFSDNVRGADLIIIGSFVPDGRAVIGWVLEIARGRTAFYDIDTPATLATLRRGGCEYLSRSHISCFDLYLSFTGGPTLRRLETEYRARRARPLYCAFDPDSYYPEPYSRKWDLGYMGTYCADRQRALERLLLEPARRSLARRFIVAGPLFPEGISWPENLDRIQHLSPGEHRAFYCSQRFTLNLTRAAMVEAGYSPSVRLFEAAACGVPIISDVWPGLETLFTPEREILLARSAGDTVRLLETLGDDESARIGARARRRVLSQHTAEHRAAELEAYFEEIAGTRLHARRIGRSAAWP
jgi:spore maturation protein CgeB